MYWALNVINVVRWAGLGARVEGRRGVGWINLKGKTHVEDLEVVGIIILKLIVRR